MSRSLLKVLLRVICKCPHLLKDMGEELRGLPVPPAFSGLWVLQLLNDTSKILWGLSVLALTRVLQSLLNVDLILRVIYECYSCSVTWVNITKMSTYSLKVGLTHRVICECYNCLMVWIKYYEDYELQLYYQDVFKLEVILRVICECKTCLMTRVKYIGLSVLSFCWFQRSSIGVSCTPCRRGSWSCRSWSL